VLQNYFTRKKVRRQTPICLVNRYGPAYTWGDKRIVRFEEVKMVEFLGAYVFGLLSPFFPALIVGVWLALLIRFGLLPLLLEREETPVDQEPKLSKTATRLALGLGLIIMPILCCDWHFGLLSRLRLATLGEENSGVILLFLSSPVWLALIVEEWLALLYLFGLPHLLDHLRIPKDRHRNIRWYGVMLILIIGIVTGLGGLNWWLHMANTDWNTLDEISSFGLVVLRPAIGLLSIGMAVMLPISLRRANFEESEYGNEHLTRRMTIVLLSTFILLSIVGYIWSASIYRLWSKGILF
jgi:hypothetical protein